MLAVVTPSFAPDADLFADLHRSVLACTQASTVHHVIVPPSDVGRFAEFAGDRCRVWTESELLPRRFRRTPRSGWWIDIGRPWPPVRGWVLQQALKLKLASMLDAEAVLIADSDVALVRPTDVERLTLDGALQLYRVDGAVHAGMERHVRWHGVARDLLALGPAPRPPLPDYVSSLNVWSPPVVRSMLDHIERSTGRTWLDAFTRRLHVSEFILYGVFVDEIWSRTHGPAPTRRSVCLDYWDRTPLSVAAALDFAEQLPDDALGMMISAKSSTPSAARRAALGRCVELALRS